MFNCTDFRVPPPPKDASQLHPGHISYVMAVGDSITAAFSARGDLYESRDISWSIGTGLADHITLPYLLANYNPKVDGMSTKKILPDPIGLPHGDYHPKTDHLNVAESEGAVHRNSMVEQWAYLNQTRQLYGPAFDTSWKVLTVWMTANDVCGQCDSALDPAFLASWVDGYEKLLRNVTATFSNVYVSLTSTLDLSQIQRLQRQKVYCTVEHEFLHECGCVGKGNATQLAQLDDNVHTMNAALRQLAVKWTGTLKAQGRTDVAVVYQNFMEGLGKDLDNSFISALDCFHPSEVAHQDLGVALWNAMLCKGDREVKCAHPSLKDITAVCPTLDSTFYSGP